jgi:hypothetical protein
MTTNPTTDGTICRWCLDSRNKPINPAMKDGVCAFHASQMLNEFLRSLYEIKFSYGYYEVQNRRGHVVYWCLSEQDAQKWIDRKLEQKGRAA